ncbi:HEAT repeat domain-containing protein [Blastopirellula marina]|nr:HEAT repeat domain-containing protein [Blastopirellula marina]
MRHLNDPCPRVQAVSAVRLVQDGDTSPEVITALVRNFDDKSYEVSNTLRTLRDISVRSLVDFIVNPSESIDRRREVAEGMRHTIWIDANSPSLKPLFDALESEDEETRTLAALMLSELDVEDNRRVAEVLVELIEQEAYNAEDAIAAIRELRADPPSELVNPVLMKWIATPGRVHLGLAHEAIVIEEDNSPIILELCQQAEAGIHPNLVFKRLVRAWYPVPPTPWLLDYLTAEIREQREIEDAVTLLCKMGEPGLKALMDISHDPEVPLYERTLCIIGLVSDDPYRDKQSLAPHELAQLESLIDDEHAAVAQAAAIALTKHGRSSPEITAQLIAAWSPEAFYLVRDEIDDTVPTDPEQRSALVSGLVLLYPKLREKRFNREADIRRLALFLAAHGGDSMPAMDVVVDAIVNHFEDEAFNKLYYARVNPGLVKRLEAELGQREGHAQLQIMEALYLILAHHGLPRDDIDIGSILAQQPPAGLTVAATADAEEVRPMAIILYSMYRPHDPQNITRLIELLRSKNAQGEDIESSILHRVNERLEILNESLEPFVPQLIAMLDSSEDRDTAAKLLGQLGPKASPAIDKLIELLADDKFGDDACRLLGSIGPKAIRAAPQILEFGLSTKPLLAPGPFSPARNRLKTASIALRQIEADTTPLQPEYDQRLADPIQQFETLEDLSNLGQTPYVADRIATALKSDNWDLKQIALDHLIFADQEQPDLFVPLLLEETKSTNTLTRSKAASALGKQKGPAKQIVPVLLHLMRSDPKVRAAAISSLGNYGPESVDAVPDLMKLIREEEEDAFNAMKALGQIGGPAKEAIPIIEEYLSGKRPAEKPEFEAFWRENSILKALGSFGPAARSALPELLAKYRDHNWWQSREEIARAIYNISPGFGAVNGIPRPPEPEPAVIQFGW